MRKKIDPVVDEAIETLNMKDGPSRRRLLEGAGLFSATAAASALIAACSSSSSSSATPTVGVGDGGRRRELPQDPKLAVQVRQPRHDNPFFVPTQNGMEDAAALLGLPAPKWGGSTTSSATEMVSYLNTAIAAKANGIATTVVSATSFTTPVKNALDAGIPVITYNANGVVNNGVPNIGTNRLCLHGPGALQLRRRRWGTGSSP